MKSTLHSFQFQLIFKGVILMALSIFLAFLPQGVAQADHEWCGNADVPESLVSSNDYSQAAYVPVYAQSAYLPPAPTCTLSASRTSVPASGGSVKFTWTSKNANGASLWGGSPSSVPVNGSQTLVVKPKIQTLQVWGPGGGTECKVAIVAEASTYAQNSYSPYSSSYAQNSYYAQSTYSSRYGQSSYYAQSSYNYSQSTYYSQAAYIEDISITATPSLVKYGGDSTITWDMGNSDSCEVTGPGFTQTGFQIGIAEAVQGEALYTLTCLLGELYDTATATVKVTPQIQET